MPKRKIKQNHQASDDEMENQRPVKQFKKQNSHMINMPSTSKDCNSNSTDSPEISRVSSHKSSYVSFASLLKAFAYKADSDDEDKKFENSSQNAVNESENSRNSCERKELRTKVVRPNSSSHENDLETNIRVLSVPSKLSQVVSLHHPASLTLHGYVEVLVWLGGVSILGYNVKEGKSIKVFSTEGTGLKRVVTVKSVHKSTAKAIKSEIRTLTSLQKNIKNIDIEEFVDNIGNQTVVLKIKKIETPPPLRFLSLYYPNALQTRWSKSENTGSFELCSTQESYTIDINEDFKMLSEEVNQIMSQPDRENFGPRIIVSGARNSGKSTLIRYLMNSALNKHYTFYFLDTDLGQTEYTPPGVVSLYRVTKPLLGPPFAHQKKALKMIFVGSLSPDASPGLYKTSVRCLVNYFDANFPNETLFVNTMGWYKGMGEMCLEAVRDVVKPTVEIRIEPPDSNRSLEKEVDEDKVTFYIPSKAPSTESGSPSYNPKELRNFNLVAYFGQCQNPYLPESRINSFRPFCISWDKIALYVMWKKVGPEFLIESIHGSIVALCCVDLSYVLESDNPEFPMTLSRDPICECLGFGLVKASDETNRLFYIVTPLKLEELKKVNALVKGNIHVPNNIFIKQRLNGIPLLYTDHSQNAKSPGLKSVPKRAFRNTLTPAKKP